MRVLIVIGAFNGNDKAEKVEKLYFGIYAKRLVQSLFACVGENQ